MERPGVGSPSPLDMSESSLSGPPSREKTQEWALQRIARGTIFPHVTSDG